MRPALRAAFVLTTLMVAACSLVVGSDSVQCTTNGDCRSRGGAFASTTCVGNVCIDGVQASDASSEGAPDVVEGSSDAAGSDASDEAGDGAVSPWGCLGKVSAPAEDQNKSVTMSYQVTSITSAPLSGMTVNVCDRTDPQCKTPIIPTPLMTDSQGMVSFQVPYAARFFVEVTASQPCPADASTCYLPALYYVDPPPTSSPPLTIIENLTPSAVGALAGSSPYDPSEGILILLVQDCRFIPGAPEPGVHFSLSSGAGGDAESPDTESFYLIDMTPSYTAMATDSDGVGGFVNVPPNPTTITGTLVQGNVRIGQNEVYVQAGTVTYATIDPYEN